MKKTSYTKILITLLLYVFIIGPLPVYAWDDCPKDKVNDPYPGDCARYIDTDNNGICDHSEPAPEDRINDVKEISKEVPSKLTFESNDSQKQLASTNLVNSLPKSSQNLNDTVLPKPLIAFGIVISHLAGILIYVTYRKRKLRKA